MLKHLKNHSNLDKLYRKQSLLGVVVVGIVINRLFGNAYIVTTSEEELKKQEL